ncbi:polycystin-2-like protein 1 [Diadema antillarum]|uniref:polycystin-2-like protein 1 n=1 Tax=Diadema antillarum TaxID=105358 RepID=UPI003A8723E4
MRRGISLRDGYQPMYQVNLSPPDYTVWKNSVWEHHHWADIDSFPYWGILATYKGGGYLAPLDCTPQSALDEARYLRNSLWIDQYTRAVFIEFVAYNPVINMFCISFLLVEFPAIGGALPYTSFRTIRLDRYQGNFAYFVLAGEVIYVAFLLYFTYREGKQLWKKKKDYFGSVWNLLEVVTLVLAYAAISFYLYRLFIGRRLVNQYREDPESFMNFQYIAHWDLVSCHFKVAC